MAKVRAHKFDNLFILLQNQQSQINIYKLHLQSVSQGALQLRKMGTHFKSIETWIEMTAHATYFTLTLDTHSVIFSIQFQTLWVPLGVNALHGRLYIGMCLCALDESTN